MKCSRKRIPFLSKRALTYNSIFLGDAPENEDEEMLSPYEEDDEEDELPITPSKKGKEPANRSPLVRVIDESKFAMVVFIRTFDSPISDF